MTPPRNAIPAVAGAVVVGLLTLAAAWISHSTSRRPAPDQPTDAESPWRLLVFSKTAGFRHGSIAAGVECVRRIGADRGFGVDATEDGARFTEDNLARYKAVVFLNTTGDVLDDDQQVAFERFIRDGGGYVGVHSAADTEYDWPWYGKLVGAYFRGHPPVQEATIHVTDRVHPATRHFGAEWIRRDEWYDFRATPAPEVKILLRVDESTYEGGGMGQDHPIGWYHEYDGGRAIYTAGGHTDESFSEPQFVQHLAGAILWGAGKARADDPAP
jgi:cytochrome c